MTKDESNYLKILGERIRGFRIGRNMTQAQLADKAGLHTVSLSAIERGNANASVLTLRNIARALEITLSELLAIGEDDSSSWQNEAEFAEILITCKALTDKDKKTVIETVKTMVERMKE